MGFFSRRGAYPVCGIFSIGHIIYLVILLSLVGVGLYLSRNVKEEGIRKQTFVIAIVIAIAEVLKISYNFIYGYWHVNWWLPVSFCALFLYTTWMAISKNETISKIGKLWISVGAIIGGASYLLYPSTSLTEVQGFHFLAVHGMSYHATMLYLGLLYLLHGVAEPTWKNFKYYAIFCLIVFAGVIIMDYGFFDHGVNLMFFADAKRLPKFVQAICEASRPLYTAIVVAFYIVIPYTLVNGLLHARDAIRAHKSLSLEEKDSVEAK